MSDDDESFVVLGSSPVPSIVSNGECSEKLTSISSKGLITDKASSIIGYEQCAEKELKDALEGSTGTLLTTSTDSTNSEKASILSASEVRSNLKEVGSIRLENNNVEADSVHSTGEPSLAASFILGEINADVLKNSLYSQFPSFASMGASSEDLKNLAGLIRSNISLKETLSQMNTNLSQFFEKAEQWKSEVESCRTEIASLRNENLNLKKDLEMKMEQVTIQEEVRQKDFDELKMVISEKTAQINNMSTEIERLEQAQLASFEYVPKNERDTKEKPDYVSRSEHQRMIKELERKTSELLAQNLDLKDMQTQYIDELNCLKVNLTAAEELIKQLHANIELLKAEDLKKSEVFTSYEDEQKKTKEELIILRHQVDIYAKDFQAECATRENLTREKDQLLQDLRVLQRKNKELIENAQKHLETMEKRRINGTASAIRHNDNDQPASSKQSVPSTDNFACPICFKKYKSFNLLNEHVNLCLKD